MSSPGSRVACAAADLVIAGWSKLSTVDWPGHLASVLFTQGCPWRCQYCHNASILDPRAPGQVEWEEVESFLLRRQGLLDAVVFSGGEPTRQAALAPAMERTRQLGFCVGMHTGGAYPKRVQQLLDANLVDWVGLDIKALPGCYGEVVGVSNAGERAWQTLRAVLEHSRTRAHFTYEVRLTTYPAFPGEEAEVARQLAKLGVEEFVLQRARGFGQIAQEDYDTTSWEQEFSRRVKQVKAGLEGVAPLGVEAQPCRPAEVSAGGSFAPMSFEVR
ncbi:MAG: anaerobic ribonucleoside-triphosphate reductase activating protein [Actinomycetaceae bacterium]|nr:anaerobic ribonucleoside-triphosphate reductase activating protein [Actinomycetaceae bacterium]